MTIFKSAKQLKWGALDLPLLGLNKDWHGTPVQPAAAFCLVMDQLFLWFVASHDKRPCLDPDARPGTYHADLWRHDVAELFLADPVSGRYIEFNLAPNGAWWCCEFTAPRIRASQKENKMPDVRTYAEAAKNGAWLSAIAMPIDLLQARIDFGTSTLGNVAFILGSPDQTFLSAVRLPGSTPDFHQPAAFQKIQITDMPPMDG